MATARACVIFQQLLWTGTRKTAQVYYPLLKSGAVHMRIHSHIRLLSSWHKLLAPGINTHKYAQGYSLRTPEEEETDIEDKDDLEELRRQHREQARARNLTEHGAKFSDHPINPKLLDRLNALGYKEPFEIQTKTFQHTLAGRNLIGKAITGSGKTLAFSIPIVNKLAERPRIGRNYNPRAIVISPTRELCLQIYRSIQELNPRVKCVPVYGGENIRIQERKMSRGVDVICATPGRLNDHLLRRNFELGEVEFLCLDEADELLTPNFKAQIEDVLENSPGNKQMMLFSATMPPHIRNLVKTYMLNPVYVDITENQVKCPESVKHLLMKTSPHDIIPVMAELLKEYNPNRAIVFMETKQLSRNAAYDMKKLGIKAEYLNSDLSQFRREEIMSAFRKGLIKVLLATDVAARGLDIPEIELIIQVKPPTNGIDYYIHRSGRTGRAGRDGVSILLHTGSPQEAEVIDEIADMVEFENCSPPDFDRTHLDGDFKTWFNQGFDSRPAPTPRQRKQRVPFKGHYSRDYNKDSERSSYSRDSNDYRDFDGVRKSRGRPRYFRDSFEKRDSYANRYRIKSDIPDDF